MGLCKCPKRKVTNQFCFEHRVNVCEHCMVTNHPKCIVQSYLAWLKDSDYNPVCQYCNHDLSNDECIRLVCFHVFHLSCLDAHARSLPRSTAPAGYTCPTCVAPVFPPPHLLSPVAEGLKEALKPLQWARTGLGLPLLDDSSYEVVSEKLAGPTEIRPEPLGSSGGTVDHVVHHTDQSRPLVHEHPVKSPHSVISIGDQSAFSRTDSAGASSRRLIETLDRSLDPDADENKYRRRSAMEWFSRYFSSLQTSSRKPRRSYRRYMVVILVILALVSLISIFYWLGRRSSYDPEFDPINNPNIRVAE